LTEHGKQRTTHPERRKVVHYEWEIALGDLLVKRIKRTSNAARMKDEPTVPNPSPPLACVFVSRSPMVAPKGRVRINAIQNKKVFEMFE
jgi:hypothetical protein